MGQVKRYECKCGYSKQISEGVGLGAINPTIIEKCVPEDIFKGFEKARGLNLVKRFVLSNAVIVCEKCGEIYTVSAFDYSLISGEKISYTGPCPECGNKCKRIENTDKIICPKCGKVMEYSIEGHWD